MLDWSLISGALPVALTVAGAAGLLALLVARRDLRWLCRTVPVVVLGSAVVVGAAMVAFALAPPFPDPLPAVAWWSLGAGVLAVGLAVAAAHRLGWLRRGLLVVAVLLVVVAAANQVNLYFGHYPTLRAALGAPPAGEVGIERVAAAAPTLVVARPGQPLSQVWRAPAGTPSAGTVSEVVIPATVSGFDARPGWIYLPPAYLTRPRARLPVLVLLHGQPGSPRDWIDGGQLAAMMDRFAAAHDGLAPVVVMPDFLGSQFANPLCLDSRLGTVQTYLTVDVPAWVKATLQVSPDPTSWAVGGFSAGGTCALQLATNAPQVYPTFVDVSGQSEPTLGERARTVDAAFAGDHRRFGAVNPLDLLASRRYPGTAGVIVVGIDDAMYRPQARQVARACRQAGVGTEYREIPGGHDWSVWGPGMEQSLPWLASRLHLIP